MGLFEKLKKSIRERWAQVEDTKKKLQPVMEKIEKDVERFEMVGSAFKELYAEFGTTPEVRRKYRKKKAGKKGGRKRAQRRKVPDIKLDINS